MQLTNTPPHDPSQPLPVPGSTAAPAQSPVPAITQSGPQQVINSTPVVPPLPKPATPGTAPLPVPSHLIPPTIPPKPSASNKKLKITVLIILFLLLCGGLAFGAYKIAISRVKKADTEAKTTVQAVSDSNFFSDESIKSLQQKITDAKTLLELETNINLALYEEPSEKEGIKLMGRAPKICLTKATIDARSELKKFVGLYTIATEEDLPNAKKAVGTFVGEYTKYPKAVSGGFMNITLMATKISKAGNGEGVVNDSTSSQSTLMSIEDLAKDANDNEKALARRLVNHQAWHSHDAIEVVNNAVDMKTKDPNISIEDAVNKSREELNAPWIALNPDGEASYTKASYSSSGNSYLTEKPAPGFATAYAKQNPFEDRATVFEYMSDADLREKIKKMAESDPIIKRKMDNITKVFSDYTIDGAKRYFGN